jgi:2-keto-3-deoxy-galactonokinase
LIAALRLLRTGPQVRARSAIRLRGAFRPSRGGITAVLAARTSVAPWFPLTIAAYIAVPVPISAIAISISIAAAAAAAIAIVPGVAMRRPMTLGVRR